MDTFLSNKLYMYISICTNIFLNIESNDTLKILEVYFVLVLVDAL